MLFYEFALQTCLGMGMGVNGTAQLLRAGLALESVLVVAVVAPPEVVLPSPFVDLFSVKQL